MRDRRLKRAEPTQVKERMFAALAALAAQHAAAPWFEDVLAELLGERDYLTSARYVEVCTAAIERNELTDVRAAGMLTLGAFLSASDDETLQADGLRWLQRVQAEFPCTKWATEAPCATIRPEDLAPGKLAPDFAASTIDGHAFKLSDYRGKVVLIDFYGFW